MVADSETGAATSRKLNVTSHALHPKPLVWLAGSGWSPLLTPSGVALRAPGATMSRLDEWSMTACRPYSALELDQLSGILRGTLVSDILDRLGRRQQTLAPGLQPIDTAMAVVGYAFTVHSIAVDSAAKEPYVGLLAALDAIGTNDVWLTTCPSDAALWGELCSTASQAKGVRGAVCDGYIRDMCRVRSIGFPVWSRGTSLRDAHGRVEVTGHMTTIEINGVRVEPGDLVVGDEDGVVIVPSDLIRDVIPAALDKDTGESQFRAAVHGGARPSDAYRRYQVL